jgi:hypothetical protein
VETLYLTIDRVLTEEFAAVDSGEGDYDNDLRAKILQSRGPLRDTARNLAHDMFKSDVLLQYPGGEVGIAILRVALRLMKEKKRVPLPFQFRTSSAGEQWYVARGMPEERMEAILKEVYGFLNRKPPKPEL